MVPPFWREAGRKTKLEQAHVQGYELVVAPLALNGHFHLHFYPTLLSILRRSRPALCHIDEEPHNLATYLAVRAARRVGARTLFFTWQNTLRHYPIPFRSMAGYVHRHVSGAIAGSCDAARVLRTKGYTGPVQVIPQFGVDPELFRPIAGPAPERPFTVGYAGRLVREKGISTLAAAVGNLSGDWRLILCGAGPMRGTLRTLFSDVGLAAHVRFHDYVPSQDMPDYLRTMDVLVLPSLTRPNWKEQFGRVLIEAMACQVPVIGSDSGEIPNVIGESGLIFPEGDAESLSQFLALLRSDPQRRRELGLAGRKRVLANYTQTKIADATVDFYRGLA